ncbi:MAG: hypothetical protein NZ869_08780 [Thermoanaerobaculum sp.]|nr:hypothetical protein [Thermoanaerobaculum sp.]MDW7967805.1 hypothetical protein [Thermoanaerobaculum sp.]
MKLSALFDPQAQERVRQAVQTVERQTAAEVVPVVVARSGSYPQAVWRAATLGALTGSVLVTLLLRLVDVWGLPWEFWLLAPPLVGAGIGLSATHLSPFLSRLFLSDEELAVQVRERAEHAFLTEEVFATNQRVGMLIFVSLFERQVVVLGDRGIASRVPPSRWQQIANAVGQGIRQGRAVEALVEGIYQCAQLLVEAGLAVQPGDTNELADRLRLSER